MWYDMHTHLDKLEEGVEAALNLAREARVIKLVTIGTDPEDLKVVLDLAKKYEEVYCTLGIHPHDGGTYTEEVGQFIEANLSNPKVIAVGEIGLDYFYKTSPVEVQLEAFRAQLEIAKKYKMPVEIHTRDAEADTVNLLKEFKGDVRGIIHCFTGTEWLARQCLDLGFNISISGVATFKNAEPLREIVRMLPLDRIHVETDAPFLAPIPKRGRSNTPAYIVHTAEMIAQIKGLGIEQLAEQTRNNAHQMFPKILN